MSARFHVGPYRFSADSHGWAVGRVREREQEDGTREEVTVAPSYFGTLTQALAHTQDRWVRESEAETIHEVLAELRAFRSEVAGLFALRVEEPTP